jgi:2-polyprenyl-3-methyl-5-hydroxy-6-metoxy-1,4-benzoquinol methylase
MEDQAVNNATIVDFLANTTANATFLQKMKIKYRPFVCPFDELLAYAQPQKSAYDIGCGSGQFCALLAKFTDVDSIHGIEIDQSLIDNARKINADFTPQKDITFSLFDGNVIPEDVANYDLIYMIDVYHHIPQKIRSSFMQQLYDKMKPGAKLMFKDINGSSPFVLCNKVHDLIFAQEFGHEIGFNNARQLLESLGFKTLEARTKQILVYPHYFLLVQK